MTSVTHYPLQVGQRVRTHCASIAGKQWEPNGILGTIAEVYVGQNTSGYYVRLDNEPERLTFCKPEEVVPIDGETGTAS